MNPLRRPLLTWALVVVFAITVWLLPLLLVWLNAQDPRRALRRAGLRVDLPPSAAGPLILYAEAWPTRAVIDLDEIQGASDESDVILGAKVIASDLALALRKLGVASESRRLDSVTDLGEVLAHRQIVLVYPTRHDQPPWQVVQFIDRELEPLIARQDPSVKRLMVRDVVISEAAAPAGHAQATLAATMRYYGIDYRPGPALLEPMNSLEIFRHLQDLAGELPSGTNGESADAPEKSGKPGHE